jgi:hypothetical protein
MFGIRNLRKPRELSQPNQLNMVGPKRRLSNFPADAPMALSIFSSLQPEALARVPILHCLQELPTESRINPIGLR